MLSEKYAGVEKLKACRTKEELLDITARYAPSVFPVRFPSPDRKPTAETVRDAILYARLGAEIAKVMDAEGYGNHPAEDAFRYYHRAEPLFRDIALSVMEHELRKGLLREERSRAPDLSEEEIVERITRVKPVDLLSTAETILRAYLFDPDFPLPKCEAERILARVRLPSDSILSMTDDALADVLSKELESLKPIRIEVREMADRVDRSYGITDPNDPHRMFHHELIMLENPANAYMPLRKLDGLFAVVEELLRILDHDCPDDEGIAEDVQAVNSYNDIPLSRNIENVYYDEGERL